MNIKLIVLDVDGVLTDSSLLIGSNGTEYKSFSVKDGMGISLALFSGIKVAFLTGRLSEAVRVRSKELKVNFLYEGISNKREILLELIGRLGIELENVFYMGDDINDLPIIRLVGFSAAPLDAVNIIKNEVDFVSKYNGGKGAVREAIDFILNEQNNLSLLVTNYLKQQKIMQ